MRDWTPVLSPDGTYCSPACGMGCSKAAYDRAVKESAALVARLGDGWEAHVWENLGWHYDVRKAGMQVMRIRPEGYSALLNTEAKSFMATGETPEDVVQQIVRQIDRAIGVLAGVRGQFQEPQRAAAHKGKE